MVRIVRVTTVVHRRADPYNQLPRVRVRADVSRRPAGPSVDDDDDDDDDSRRRSFVQSACCCFFWSPTAFRFRSNVVGGGVDFAAISQEGICQRVSRARVRSCVRSVGRGDVDRRRRTHSGLWGSKLRESVVALPVVGAMTPRARERRGAGRRRTGALTASLLLVSSFAAAWTVTGALASSSSDWISFDDTAAATEIVPGAPAVTLSLAQRAEAYFYFDVASQQSPDFVVEVERTSGIPSPILKINGTANGNRVVGHEVTDGSRLWMSFDREEMGHMADYHSLKVVSATAGRYRFRVYNAPELSRQTGSETYSEAAAYTLRVRSTDDGTSPAPLCPWDCGNRGVCQRTGSSTGDDAKCECSDTVMPDGVSVAYGPSCRDKFVPFSSISQPQYLEVPAGSLLVTSANLVEDLHRADSRGVEITVEWQSESGGELFLLVNFGSAPTLDDSEYAYTGLLEGGFSSVRFLPDQIESAGGGDVYVGVFNKRFSKDGTAKIRISIDTARSPWDTKSPTVLSMAIVLFVSLAICVVVTFVKRYFWRRYVRQLRMQRVFAQLDEQHGRRGPQVGTPPTVINSLQVIKYDAEQAEELKRQGEEPTCTICLEDYNEGDELRRMPHCRHVFHQECSDLWLRSSQTCPNCRTSVFPWNASVAAGNAAQIQRADEAPSQSDGSPLRPSHIELSTMGQTDGRQVIVVQVPYTEASQHGTGPSNPSHASV